MEKNLQIFKAAYFGDLQTLKELVISENDSLVKISVPKDDRRLFWRKTFFEINILEILNWQNFAFYEYFDSLEASYITVNADKEEYKVSFNPSVHYRKIIDCLDYFCGLLDIFNYKIKDYSNFRSLRTCKDVDENYLDDDEIIEALNKGFMQLDLDLLNEAEKGNAIKVYELIQEGANPEIDPVDFSEESCFSAVIGGDWQYHTMLTKKIIGEKDSFNSNDTYEILESLYQAGVGNYILDIVFSDDER